MDVDVRSLLQQLSNSIYRRHSFKEEGTFSLKLWEPYKMLHLERKKENDFCKAGVQCAYEILLMRKYDWYPKYTANSKKAASLERGYWAVFSLISGGRLEEGEKLKKLLKKLDQHRALIHVKESLLYLMLDLAQLQSETLEQSHIAPLAKEHLQMSVSLEDSIQEMKWQSQLFASQPGTGYSGFLNGEVCGPLYDPVQRSLFSGLTHSKTSKMNVCLALPELTEECCFLIPQSSAGELPRLELGHTAACQSAVDDSGIFTDEEVSMWAQLDISSHPLPNTWDIHSKCTAMYLTEAGSAVFDKAYRKHLCNISNMIGCTPPAVAMVTMDQLVTDTFYVLQGSASSTYSCVEPDLLFSPVSDVVTSGIGLISCMKMLQDFAELGTYYIRLEQLCMLLAEHGSIAVAMATSVRSFLWMYRSSIIHFRDKECCQTLLGIKITLHKLFRGLRFLAEWCNVSGLWEGCGDFPKGMSLLDLLVAEAECSAGLDRFDLILSMLKRSLEPFINYMQQWVFSGSCIDYEEEFSIQKDPVALTDKGHIYWEKGFSLRSGIRCVPEFVSKDLATIIFMSGKALNLLKICFPSHFLFNANVEVLDFEVTFSQRRLLEIESNSKLYEGKVHALHNVWVREQQEAKEKVRLEELAAVMKERQLMLDAAGQAKREKVQELSEVAARKKEELEDLKLQMEQDRERRALLVAEEKREDKRRLEKTLEKDRAWEEEQKAHEEQAKEELVAYYEELSREAEKRERRARWRKARIELNSKRKEFLQKDKEIFSQQLIEQEGHDGETLSEEHVESLTEPVLPEEKERTEEEDAQEMKHVENLTEPVLPGEKGRTEEEDAQEMKHVTVHAAPEVTLLPLEQDSVHSDDREGTASAIDLPSASQLGGEAAKSTMYFMQTESLDGCHGDDIQQNGNLLPPVGSHQLNDADIRDILYPDRESTLAVPPPPNTRGQAPPSTAQYLMYPDRSYEVVPKNIRYTQRDFPVIREEVEAGNMHHVHGLHVSNAADLYQDTYQQFGLLPDGGRLFDVFAKPSEIESDDGDGPGSAKDLYPLQVLLERSIVTPLRVQAGLVNASLVSYFIEQLAIKEHFTAMRQFLLLEDGEFGHVLANALFEEVAHSDSAVRLSSAIFLNPLLTKALQHSMYGDSPYASRLSFQLKYQPTAIRSTSVRALDFLELHYEVDWPCNIVITEHSIDKCNTILHFLLQLKRTSWSLKEVFAYLKKCESRGLRSSVHIRELVAFRFEMQHFVSVLQSYMSNQVLHISWKEFMTTLNTKVHSLDDLCQAHKTYIGRAIFRSLLSKKASAIMKIIREVLHLIHKFRLQLMAGEWNADDQTLSNFDSLRQIHKNFRENTQFLHMVVKKLIQRGYQPHLEDFVLRLNFNDFYAT